MPTIAPFTAAATQAASKPILKVDLSSNQFAALDKAIRVRSTFSAHVESARVLTAIKQGMENILNLKQDEYGRISSRSTILRNIQDIARQEGIETGPAGTIQDINSVPRLKLIVDMNLKQAQGYANWTEGQGRLDLNPAQRFLRVEYKEKPREDWPERWKSAAEAVQWEGVATNGEMVALKTSPIWSELSIFQTPWPPYDWGSGMGVENVSWDEAQSLGLVAEGEELKPMKDEFNSGLSASVANMDPALVARVKNSLGNDTIEIDGDDLVFVGD